jgi:transcriptional regulator with XRE-family HTH domain
MVTDDPPAVARRRVRLALRRAREGKRLTQTQVAEAMEWSLSKVMRIESGEVSVSPTDLRALLPLLGVTDGSAMEQLFNDARVARRQRWSINPEYREHLTPALVQLMQFEQEAATIRYFHPLLVPGLLQTPAYAAEIFRIHVLGLSEETIRVRIDARLDRRRRLLSQPNPPEYLAILDESVLYREIGGPQVMGEQLRDLLEVMTATPGMQVRILPFTAGIPIALLGPFSILDMGDDQAPILYRESPRGDEIVAAQRELREHHDIFERLWPRAYGDAESKRIIQQRADALIDAARRSRPSG